MTQKRYSLKKETFHLFFVDAHTFYRYAHTFYRYKVIYETVDNSDI